jgi:hypothetical protein
MYADISRLTFAGFCRELDHAGTRMARNCIGDKYDGNQPPFSGWQLFRLDQAAPQTGTAALCPYE